MATMKQLTVRFMKIFNHYDYEECNIDVLMKLLDIVLDMMKIVDLDDTDDIKRLSSFIKVLSSDFCRNIINSDIIDDIYDDQIIPIFVKFDNKYENKICEVEDLPEHRAMSFIEKAKEKAKTLVKKVFHREERKSNSTKNADLIYYTEAAKEENDTVKVDDDKVLFSMLKRTSDKVMMIYDRIMKKKGDDKQILRELYDIQASATVSSTHCNEQINLLSMAVYKVSDFLIDALSKRDYNMILENQRGLEESFEFMNKLHYPPC